jgi:hypothetical protein
MGHMLVTVMILGLVTIVKLETFVTMLIVTLEHVGINVMDMLVIVMMDIEVLTVKQLITVFNRHRTRHQFVKMDLNVEMAEKDQSVNVRKISLVNFVNFKISV